MHVYTSETKCLNISHYLSKSKDATRNNKRYTYYSIKHVKLTEKVIRWAFMLRNRVMWISKLIQ